LIRAQIARTWSDSNLRGGVFELHGQQLVVVGLGDIGLQVVELAQPFGLRATGVRRRSLDQTIRGLDRITDLAGLPAALRSADHVVIALPLTHRTRHLFDAEMIAQMKPTAYLYNIGRGAIVDTAALIDALHKGRLAGAGLDVTDPEPLPTDSPLWSMENVIITAHTSGATPRYWDRGLAVLEENIRRFAAGEPLVNVVDLAEGY
jgi:phosphoglycerate dehydrogenase-like enzyme